MKYLIVVAHPDDEVLGAGASIHKWVKNGDVVDVCIMCSEANARTFRPESDGLDRDLCVSSKLLGINKLYKGFFPNIEMNTIPHLEMVRFVEKTIVESAPDVIITHHPADLNNDHVQTSQACQAAMRLFQRRAEVKSIREFWYMEVLSSTDWNVNTSTNRFFANTFVEVGTEGVDIKKQAMHAYRGVMRPYPHPRSNEGILGLATYRGSQSGCNYAEAFECVLRKL